MKRISIVLIVVSLFLTSCASHYGLPKNYNQNTTEVVLTKKNFKIVKIVKGEAEATYIFGIGGLAKNGLVAEAKAKMLETAGMEGNPRTIINEVVEVKTSGFLFINKYKVIVSALIVEFTE
jgi:PBP1b-binding outer membrane lipoprotein LpoB